MYKGDWNSASWSRQDWFDFQYHMTFGFCIDWTHFNYNQMVYNGVFIPR